ncbi:MAG: phosphate ABC transporter, permease protein PstA [Halobacteriovorax sp.]|nr:phosphate ABC transporter, permease protein PstA [Halobacteriovorax sp.]
MNQFKFRKVRNKLFLFSLSIAAVVCLAPLIMVTSFMLQKGAASLDLDFFTKLPVPVGEAGGGMLHAILGTIYMVTLGSLMAVPLGLIGGIYLSEYGKGGISKALRLATDVMTGIPSIIIGIFAYILLVVPFKSFSALSGAVALAIIILPVVIRSSEEILKLVPKHIREAGLALGLPRWKVILFIIVRGNLSALFTGVMLAIARASGETAPLLFTAFGNMYLSYSPMEPMASLPVQIYTYAISPFEDWQRQSWAGAFVLIILVIGVNLGARFLMNPKALKNFLKRSSS